MSDSPAVQVVPAPYVRIPLAAAITGLSEKAIRRRWSFWGTEGSAGVAHQMSSDQRDSVLMATKTALYRHFDDEGRLLYVGISLDPLKRTAEHMRQSYWADRIRGISIEWFGSRGMAMDAEERAILDEEPCFNVVGRSFVQAWEPEFDDDHEMAMLEAAIRKGAV